MAKPKENLPDDLSKLLSAESLDLLKSNGLQLAEKIGIEAIRDVVLAILSGKNFRDSTEFITRRRISFLNLALFELFLHSSDESAAYQLIERAVDTLQKKRVPKAERWLAQWVLGLTDKASQNILRDDPGLLASYRTSYIKACDQVVRDFQKKHGRLSATIKINGSKKGVMSWTLLTYLFNAIGAETLTIRGSAKSTYGKLFEKLVLGSLLHILGFTYAPEQHAEELRGVFWLASSKERRQSDATLIYEAGKGVRFDIGFIGRGNPEISLDKVSRFEREISLGSSKWYMATIIIVDRIGERSRIERLAREIGGSIVQMSMGYWPQEVARILRDALGYQHELASMQHSEIGSYLAEAIKKVPLESFLNNNASGG